MLSSHQARRSGQTLPASAAWYQRGHGSGEVRQRV